MAESAKKPNIKAPKAASAAVVADPANAKEYAVIATGGKQYVVSAGSVIKIEKLTGEYKEGDIVTFDKVLLVDNGSETTIGTPYIQGAHVKANLEKIGRLPKVEAVKYKQKSRYFKRYGHRQPYFQVKITAIS